MAGAAGTQEVQRARQMQEQPEGVVVHRLVSIADIAIEGRRPVIFRNNRGAVTRAPSI
jgi:hypothetical protein